MLSGSRAIPRSGISIERQSILKTTKGGAPAWAKKKKVDEGKSKIKAAESDEEQQLE